MFGGRIVNYIRENQLVRKVGQVVLGTQSPSGTEALPSVPNVIASTSKIITMGVGMGLTLMDRTFGWNLMGSIGPDAETIILFVVSMYLGWRVPQRTSS